jgi:metal-responsive CopG/Arc/MetJ family transcriptional regulator
MKVAVSVPDPLFRDAEAVSRRLRVPRSQLYARALEAFVRKHSADDVTARLDAVIARLASEDLAPSEGPALEVLRRERW